MICKFFDKKIHNENYIKYGELIEYSFKSKSTPHPIWIVKFKHFLIKYTNPNLGLEYVFCPNKIWNVPMCLDIAVG